MNIRSVPVLFSVVKAHQKTLVAYVDPTLRFALQVAVPGTYDFTVKNISSGTALALAERSADVLTLMNDEWVFEAADVVEWEGHFRARLFKKYEDALAYAQVLVPNATGTVCITPCAIY